MRLCLLTNWDNPSDIPQGAQKTDRRARLVKQGT